MKRRIADQIFRFPALGSATQQALLALSLSLLFFAITQANFLFIIIAPNESDWAYWVPIWFSNGIAPLLVHRFGKSALIGIVISSYATETVVMHNAALAAALITLANAMQAGLVYKLLVRYTGPDLRIGDSPAAVMRFFAITLVVTAGISAPIGTLAYAEWNAPQLLMAWARWTFGDMTAFVIVTPFCRFIIARDTRPLAKSMAQVSFGLALSVLVFSDWSWLTGKPFLPVSFVLFPAIILLAVHSGRRATTTVTFGVGIVAAAMTAAGFGAFAAWGQPSANIFMLQAFLIALGVSGLMLAALSHERAVARQRLQATLRYLDRLVDERTDELNRANQRLRHTIAYDGLTKCYSRQGFIEALEARTGRLDSAEGERYLLYIDLDGFKLVNDTHGHQRGDALLAEIAERFLSVSGKHAVVARIGGDEFAVASDYLPRRDSAVTLARRLIAACYHTHNLQNSKVEVSASIGIAPLPDDSRISVTDLLDRADTAMYAAKRSGRGSVRWVDREPGTDLAAAMI